MSFPAGGEGDPRHGDSGAGPRDGLPLPSLRDASPANSGERLSRRLLLGAALALTACKGRAQGPPARGPAPPLKSLTRTPIGCCVMTGQLADPAYARLLVDNVSQITPEWEMKMEYILKDDGSFRFDAPDAIAAFARDRGLRLYATTLVWFAQDPPAFRRLDGAGKAFADAYRNYILAVAGRYRGQAVGWDVVNEPVAEDGNGLRPCLWSRNLGQEDYMVRAFEHAAEADPGAVLFINDYDLETRPRKRATFLRLVERLLARGARVGGVGTQSHLNADLQPGAVTAAIRELASLGLPVHISELDVSLARVQGLFADPAALQARQARLYAEATEAFMALPPRQRFALTIWGLRDADSWLRAESQKLGTGKDTPVLFDDRGEPKATFWALADALR